MRVDQALLDRVKERRAVAPGEAETLGPGIDMGVEMDERQRTCAARQSPQQRQGHGVVAAQCDKMAEWCGLLLDPRQAPRNVAMGDREIADVGNV